MPDKLTDNEVLKALECCDGSFDRCGECPLDNIIQDKLRCWELEKSALDLINRLQAKVDDKEDTIQYADKVIKQLEKCKDTLICEKLKLLQQIESLQADNEELTKDKENLAYSLANAVGQKMTAKTEAYKEFAEWLKSEIVSDTAYGCDSSQHSGYYDYQIKIGDIPEYIDNLLKEMVGADNG